jgi:hypothetical protein
MFPPSHRHHFRNSPPLGTGIVGLLTFLLAFFCWPKGIGAGPIAEFHLFLGLICLVMLSTELLVFHSYRQQDARLCLARLRHPGPFMYRPLIDKAIAVLATGLAAGMIYQLVPLYQLPWYRRFVDPALGHMGLILIAALLCVWLTDKMMTEKEDALSQTGRFLRSLGREGDRRLVADYALGWLVKIFFLPLMYGYALDDWLSFYGTSRLINSFRAFYEFMYQFIFFADVTFAILGYGLALRLINSHLRHPERSLSGWCICLICYMPFWQIFGRDFFSYEDQIVWGPLLEGQPLIYMLWGSTILLLLCIYLFSTLSFGLRFSNITFRGTVFRGPYGFTRHPAYLSKNTVMWMVQLPLLAATPRDALAHTAALIGINTIYFLRARHEERCCGMSRDYRLYARYIDRFGLFSRSRWPRLKSRRQPSDGSRRAGNEQSAQPKHQNQTTI